MHILITGAAGMVGRKLTERLVAEDGLNGKPVDKLTLVDIVAPKEPAGFSGKVDAYALDISREEIRLGDLVLQQRREVEIRAGEVILRIRFVQIVRVVVDDAAGEQIDAEEWILPANFEGIERPGDVVPTERADESLIAVGEFLAAEFQ